MAEPLSMLLLDGAIGWAVGRAADSAGKRLKRLLSNAAARRELVEVGARAVDAAVAAAPELASDLGSEAYLHNVLAPALLAVLEDPTDGLSAEQTAQAYVQRFVEPYLRGRNVEDVFTRIYRLQPERLDAAFSLLVSTMRSGLYKSIHWREAISAIALEEVRMGVLGIQEHLSAPETRTVDLRRARQDARIGSEGLRSWSQTISGLHLDRPELSVLRERIRSQPAATSLLVGPAGSGKSALLAELTSGLEQDGMIVFAIKADLLPDSVQTLADIGDALGMAGDISAEIEALSRAGPIVLIIDQLDAVSEVMDRSSRRMQLLLQLATRWRADDDATQRAPVHVVVSSRPFEASHDARFQSLRAQEVSLELPAWPAVSDLLLALGLDSDAVPETLREPLRRPFLLKLFVELAQRGEPVAGLVEGELLNAWLRTAPLGNRGDRKEVLDLLKALALDMTATETLWRPADRFDQDFAEAVRRAEACELVIRRGHLLGFAHQSWLDDFQARAFATGRALAEHAWSTQDGLFGRATILRALERLRAYEADAYADAIDALLGQASTRRHLRHLTVDFIATQSAPLPREIGWVIRLISEDTILAQRAVRKLVPRWAGWREALKPQIPAVHSHQELAFSAVAMVVAEAGVDPLAAERLLQDHWAAPERDLEAFEICRRGAMWSPVIRERLTQALGREQYSEHSIAAYAEDLLEKGRGAAAAELIGAYVATLDLKSRGRVGVHGVEKVVDSAPSEFVDAVLPWFLDTASRELDSGGLRDRYPRSRSLPFDWQEEDGRGNVFGALQRALVACAQAHPDRFREIVEQLSSVEFDEAQALVAEAYAAAGPGLADDAAVWLLKDRRRLSVGSAHVQGEDNVGRMLHDYSTRELLKGTTPHLDGARLIEVRDALEAWDPYTEEARSESKPEDRRRWRQWAEEHRANLLALLPDAALAPRRRRQVRELVATQPRIRPGRGIGMASFVPSPMSSEAMALASDDDLFRMIDEVNDFAEERLRRGRRGRMEGGVGELAQAFGRFGKTHPVRAMNFVRNRFRSGRHEQAAGALLRELAKVESVLPEDLVELVWELHRRGFSREDWRRDVAWALEGIAGRANGVGDDEINLLESWIIDDPAEIADRVRRREQLDQINRERNAERETRPRGAMLFGRGLGGMMILPQGNYTVLAAMAAGVLYREPPEPDAWLSVLERHVHRPEDPHVWASLLASRGDALYAADRNRVIALFEALCSRFPSAFEATTSHTLWRCRQMLPASVRGDIVLTWLNGQDERMRQLAGEFCTAGAIVDEQDVAARVLADAILGGPAGEARTGALYAAAAAWRETDPGLRTAGHAILAPRAAQVSGEEAEAVSTALDMKHSLPPDQPTRELLAHAITNGELLKACINKRFLDALQGLLLHPGFEDLVLDLAEASLDVVLAREGRGAMIDGDLVSIAVTLQRAKSDRRGRAMDFYERLLEAEVYGADKAAQDSLRR